MKKNILRKEHTSVRLGDLICALYDEAKEVSADRVQQRFMVYAALKDLLTRKAMRSATKAAA